MRLVWSSGPTHAIVQRLHLLCIPCGLDLCRPRWASLYREDPAGIPHLSVRIISRVRAWLPSPNRCCSATSIRPPSADKSRSDFRHQSSYLFCRKTKQTIVQTTVISLSLFLFLSPSLSFTSLPTTNPIRSRSDKPSRRWWKNHRRYTSTRHRQSDQFVCIVGLLDLSTAIIYKREKNKRSRRKGRCLFFSWRRHCVVSFIGRQLVRLPPPPPPDGNEKKEKKQKTKGLHSYAFCRKRNASLFSHPMLILMRVYFLWRRVGRGTAEPSHDRSD